MLALDDAQLQALLKAASRVPIEHRSEFLNELATVSSQWLAGPDRFAVLVERVATAYSARHCASGDCYGASEIATLPR